MQCCMRCANVTAREYRVDGDGDGTEFLTEITRRSDGRVEEESVIVGW